MAAHKNTLTNNLKLLIPAFLLMLVVFAGIGFSMHLDRKSEQQARTQSAAGKSAASNVAIDGVFSAKLPCAEPDGPQVQHEGGTRTATYTCALVKKEGGLDKVYFASNKSYTTTATITPAVDYAFCGTYTDSGTGEVMANKADQERQVNSRTFRICEYVGDKGTLLYTAKTLSGNSLQTFTVFGPAKNMRDMMPEFEQSVASLRFTR